MYKIYNVLLVGILMIQSVQTSLTKEFCLLYIATLIFALPDVLIFRPAIIPARKT